MRRGRSLQQELLLSGFVVASLTLATGLGVRAAANLEHAVAYYGAAGGVGEPITSLVASRYSIGIAGLSISEDATAIRSLNPDFHWFIYNSITDNYVDSQLDPEDALLETLCQQMGIDHEECYLHFYDDTTIHIQGQDVLVQGWGGGTADVKSESRVPVYNANLSRRAVNFSTPEATRVNLKAILALSLERTFEDTALYPDGICLDNSACKLFNTGQVISGGHVLEAAGRSVIGSPEFQTWHWNRNLGPFLTALKDTLETSETWSMDGRRKELMINIANSWTESFIMMDVADILSMELRYDPVRDYGDTEVNLAWQRDRFAADAEIRLLYVPLMQDEVMGHPGQLSHGQALLGSLAWNLTTRTDESLLFLYGGHSNVTEAGWDTLTWHGCVDVVKDRLGIISGDPYVFTEGVDATGKSYRVWARNYENGLVLVRNRGRADEGIEVETRVAINLPVQLSLLSPSGEVGEATGTIELGNGEAAILLGAYSVDPPPGHPEVYFTAYPEYGRALQAVQFTDRSTNEPSTWSWAFGDGEFSTERNPLHNYSSAGSYQVRLTATNEHGSGTRVVNSFVTVEAPLETPVVDFIGSPTMGEVPLRVSFTDLSADEPDQWLWTFGDGSTSTSKNPTHVYTQTGVYPVELTASNSAGADTETKTGYIVATSQGAGTTEPSWTLGLGPVQPNPIRSSARIPFSIPGEGQVNLEVFGIDGRFGDAIFNGRLQRGQHHIVWVPQHCPAGLYLVRLRYEGGVRECRVIVLK